MYSEYLYALYAHNTWANERLFATALALTPEEFTTQEHASFGTLRDVLVHMVSVQRGWLARVKLTAPPPPLAAADFADVASLLEQWRQIDAETHAFVDVLGDGAAAEVIRYNSPTGAPRAFRRWQLLVHQATHAAQHRSEVALILTQMGHSTGDLDFLRYVDAMEQPLT